MLSSRHPSNGGFQLKLYGQNDRHGQNDQHGQKDQKGKEGKKKEQNGQKYGTWILDVRMWIS